MPIIKIGRSLGDQRKGQVMSISNVGSVAAAPVYTGGEHAAYDGGAAAAPVESAPAATLSVSTAPAETATPQKSAEAKHDDAELEKIMEGPVKQANIALRPYDRQIEREIHQVTKALMYTIRDTKTNEVIAEYPPKKIQDMIAKMWELAGLFIDQKA
jgi:uncharacterized FlaG/YvyC family protein